MSTIQGTVVLDPGHGGKQDMGGSDANHAVSPTGVLEKDLTFEIAQLVERSLCAAAPGVRVIKTRGGDTNLSLASRANVARDNAADVFLSIHFNGFDGTTRGVEAFVRPKAKGNVNYDRDLKFAQGVQTAVLNAIKARDPKTRDRRVKEMALGVLADGSLGNTSGRSRCRSCLLEIEFMDVPAVENLLISGPDASAAKQAVADAISSAILQDLASY